MNALDKTDEPALFISRTGAAEAGLKLIAKLPRRVRRVKVTGPHGVGDSKGFHLWAIPHDTREGSRRLTEQGLSLLHAANTHPPARQHQRR